MQNIKVAGSHFGKSVSIIATGTIMAIGADHYDEVRPKAGAVYVLYYWFWCMESNRIN